MAEAPPPERDFGGFYQRTLVPLRRYLLRFTRNTEEAQDLAQDAYAKVYPVMQARDLKQSQAFLYTTARNLALDRLKRRARSPFDAQGVGEPGETTASGAPRVESVVMAREEWALLQHAIANLPPGCRQVLHLRMVARLSHAEIAQELGLARSSVEKHLMRAVRLLHEAHQAARMEPGPRVLPIERRAGTDD